MVFLGWLMVADQGSEFYFHTWPGHCLCIEALRVQQRTYQMQPGPNVTCPPGDETGRQPANKRILKTLPSRPRFYTLLLTSSSFFQRRLAMSERVLFLEPRQIFKRRHGPKCSLRHRSQQPQSGQQPKCQPSDERIKKSRLTHTTK